MSLDPVREKFAKEVHQHGNASEAYRTAKPRSRNWTSKVVHNKASEMLKQGEVQVRLSQLQQRSAEKHDITVASLTEMLKEDRELAQQFKQASAAVSAVMGLAKIHGLIIDKNALTDKDGENVVPVLNVTVSQK